MMNLVPGPPEPDAGLRVVAGIYKSLMIDEEWSVVVPRGFHWLGWRLAQTVHASEPFEDVGMSVSRVYAVTAVVRDIRADDSKVEREVALLNRVAAGSAWIFDRESRALSIANAMTVHDETAGFREQQLNGYAILQLIEAEEKADDLAQRLGGEVAVVEHPESGRRYQPDEMRGLPKLIAERSGNYSAFAEFEEMQSVYEFAKETNGGAFSAGASADGVCVEVPFGANDTALIELLTNSPHPSLGNGLLVLSRVRAPMTLTACLACADRLNEIAFMPQVVFPLLGAWSAWKMDADVWSVAFSTFVPNLWAGQGVARDAASTAVFRLAQLDRSWFPQLGPRNVLEIISRRMHAADAHEGELPGVPILES
jgi:hypothetical protein